MNTTEDALRTAHTALVEAERLKDRALEPLFSLRERAVARLRENNIGTNGVWLWLAELPSADVDLYENRDGTISALLVVGWDEYAVPDWALRGDMDAFEAILANHLAKSDDGKRAAAERKVQKAREAYEAALRELGLR